MIVETVVDKLLEQGEEFNAREYLNPTPAEQFDLALKPILEEARKLYERLKAQKALDLAAKPYGAPRRLPDRNAIAQAVLKIALERSSNVGTQTAYLRIKRYAHHIL